jgi:hypothetical protein
MPKNYLKIIINSILLAIIGVWGVDYIFHFLFSSPMETQAYFMAKMTLYLLGGVIFLSFFNLNKHRFLKVLSVGIVIASLWGIYYNILPILFDFYPFGIPLNGLSFLGMGILGTGLSFGIVHVAAFVCGYYLSQWIWNLFSSFKNNN